MDKIDLVKSKIMDRELLRRTLGVWRFQDKKIVFTNGCFDLLHKGHVIYLNQAKEQGDILIVAINSDSSIRKLKGPERPIIDEGSRALVLSNLKSVDYAVVFEEDTAEVILGKIKPDVYVKGADYSPKTLPEASIVKSYGGRVHYVDLVPGYSTSGMANQILDSRDKKTL